MKPRSLLPQPKLLYARISLKEQKKKKTLVIPGKKFKNEMGAYLELLQMIRQALQRAIMLRTDPRLIKCLQEKERKFPNVEKRKKAKSVKCQSPIKDAR